MKQVELLRHVADNLEAGRGAGDGLMYLGARVTAKLQLSAIALDRPELFELAPKTRVINGVEVPAPMDKEPKRGTRYWVECAGVPGLFTGSQWDGADVDKLRLSRGLCYDSPEAAAANCRARYGIAP